MKKISLLVIVGMGCVVMTGCGTSDTSTPEASVQELPAGTYAVESCNKYLDFVECSSAFSSPDDQEQMNGIIDEIKAAWDTLPSEELQTRCDEMWNMVVSIPELADHPQCGIAV